MRYNNNYKKDYNQNSQNNFKERISGALAMCLLFAVALGVAYLLDYFELIELSMFDELPPAPIEK